MKSIGILLLLAVLIPLNGWCVQCLWNWFVAPLGVAAISIWTGAGLDVLFTFMCPTPQKKYETTREKIEARVDMVVKPLIMLGLGWLIHLFK